jgi:ribosomal protein S18 acetylase RimI-like enzyme
VEVELLDAPHWGSARPLLADIGNLEVSAGFRRRGVGRALLAEACKWLSFAEVELLLAYASPQETSLLGFLSAQGFELATRTERGWTTAAV